MKYWPADGHDLTYIALQGHQACLQSWPFWEAFEYKFVLEDVKEKSENKLHEQFWLVSCMSDTVLDGRIGVGPQKMRAKICN